jgi:hypothetical protein
MEEIWKDITDYEGYFQVSNFGNFRSLDRIIKYKQNGIRLYPGKLLKVEICLDGYRRIVLMKEAIKTRYMCHRLVAQMFIPNPDSKPFVNHLNGNKSDNRVCNLEWCTQSENELHSVNFLGKCMKGKTFPKKIKCITTNVEYNSMSEVIRFLGNHSCIEGLKKSIEADRDYHNFKFQYI